MKTIVRRAGVPDLAQIVPMFDAYRQFYKLASDSAGARAFIAQRLERGDSAIFIAHVDGKAAGFVQLYPLYSSLQMKPALILNDLFVHPAHRGKGVARVLMEVARQYGIESGAASLTLETAPDNKAARQLYESLGYKLEQSFLMYVLTL